MQKIIHYYVYDNNRENSASGERRISTAREGSLSLRSGEKRAQSTRMRRMKGADALIKSLVMYSNEMLHKQKKGYWHFCDFCRLSASKSGEKV